MNKEILNYHDDSIFDVIEEGVPIPAICGRPSPEANKFTKILHRMKPLNSLLPTVRQAIMVKNLADKFGFKLATRSVAEHGEKMRRVWLLDKNRSRKNLEIINH
jgi:hypothetical protein